MGMKWIKRCVEIAQACVGTAEDQIEVDNARIEMDTLNKELSRVPKAPRPPRNEAQALQRYRCPSCGSSEVQQTAWVWVNGGAIAGGDPPPGPYFCAGCEAEPERLLEPGEPFRPTARHG